VHEPDPFPILCWPQSTAGTKTLPSTPRYNDHSSDRAHAACRSVKWSFSRPRFSRTVTRRLPGWPQAHLVIPRTNADMLKYSSISYCGGVQDSGRWRLGFKCYQTRRGGIYRALTSPKTALSARALTETICKSAILEILKMLPCSLKELNKSQADQQ